MKPQQLPTRKLLAEVNPASLDKLPKGYKGSSPSVHLAYAFGKALENGLTYQDIVEANPDIPEYFDTENGKTYADLILRLGGNEELLTSYYGFYSIFGNNELTVPQIYFAVALAIRYPDTTLSGAVGTFSSIYKYQTECLQRKANKVVLPSIKDFDNISALGSLLRSEGIIMPQANLWVASSHWTPKEILLMLEEGLNLEKAMELYLLGFTTMEDIVSYSEILPDSWIDRILNGPPKVE